jgi:hypothetical protein
MVATTFTRGQHVADVARAVLVAGARRIDGRDPNQITRERHRFVDQLVDGREHAIGIGSHARGGRFL